MILLIGHKQILSIILEIVIAHIWKCMSLMSPNIATPEWTKVIEVRVGVG